MNLHKLFTELPLYEIVKFTSSPNSYSEMSIMHELLHKGNTFDMYCVECQAHSVFKQDYVKFSGNYTHLGQMLIPQIKDDEYFITAKCSRNDDHNAMVMIRFFNHSLMKIGQYPSLADILTPDLKRYAKAIGTTRVREWSKAIGLSAHGIGAGSYVYLRRIIESLIEDAHILAKENSEWEEEIYKRSRYGEKIGLLAGYLPDFIVENKNAYSILSKGIHELDENTCLSYFDVLHSAIELIAEESLAKFEVENRRIATEKALSRITSEI